MRLGVPICEDVWTPAVVECISETGGEIILVPNGSPYDIHKLDSDKDGTVLESYESTSERVLEPQIARQINDVLSDNVARTPEFGANSPLYFTKTAGSVQSSAE